MIARLVKYINIAIALVAVVGLALIYWFVYRALPQTSKPFRFRRPPSSAPPPRATAWACRISGRPPWRMRLVGYVIAQDRLWQIDVAAGRGKSPKSWGRPLWKRTAIRGGCGCAVSPKLYINMPPEDRKEIAAFARQG